MTTKLKSLCPDLQGITRITNDYMLYVSVSDAKAILDKLIAAYTIIDDLNHKSLNGCICKDLQKAVEHLVDFQSKGNS